MDRSWRVFLQLVVMVGCTISGGRIYGKVSNPLPKWSGEFFRKDEGGLYLKVALKGFSNVVTTTSVTIHFFSPISKESFVIQHRLNDISAPPDEFWKMKSGKYFVLTVVVIDDDGLSRSFTARRGKSFVIKKLSLSNLGLWTISPQGAKGLKISLKMIPNSYREKGPANESSVANVIDGFTGLTQEIIGGNKLHKAAQKDFSTRDEMRATVTYQRKISMFYSLNLYQHNSAYGEDILHILQIKDPELRQCYQERLEFVNYLAGQVTFKFLLSKKSNSMKSIKKTGGNINDPKLIKCLYYELAGTQFPVKTNMVGEVTYTFGVID